MSRVITSLSPRKDQFMTVRVTQEFRDKIGEAAAEAMRSASAQALYYMQIGMSWEAHEERARRRQDAS